MKDMPDGYDEQCELTSKTQILPQSHWALRITKIFSAILFGLIIPGIITFNVMTNLSQLEESINSKQNHQDLVDIYIQIKAEIEEQNQYALASYMFASAANQNTLINKQIMKTVAIHIGFAVLSFGVLFIILGINQGPISVSGSLPDTTSIDIKSGSLGVGVMLIGAFMVTTAAIHKNEYRTVTIPAFQPSTSFVKALSNAKTRNDILKPIDNMSTRTNTENTNSSGHNKGINLLPINPSNFPIKLTPERDEQNEK